MKPPQNTVVSDPLAVVDLTLRTIAGLPAPEGLAGRVQAGLNAAPRRARTLSWPVPTATGVWMRGAAAAAIVCLVAGGGWGIYLRVQPAPSAQAVPVPVTAAPAGGFSSAGAIRIPDTRTAPVLTHAIAPRAESAAQESAKPPASIPQHKKRNKLDNQPKAAVAH